MLIKTSNLKDLGLDWAVAIANGLSPVMRHNYMKVKAANYTGDLDWHLLMQKNDPIVVVDGVTEPIDNPSTDWLYGGPIIEREDVEFVLAKEGGHHKSAKWMAIIRNRWFGFGEDHLISAMRYISTSYTVCGYETEMTEGDQRTELFRGGNHRMCSESRLVPSIGPWDVNDHRMTITEVKAVAQQAHKEACADNPDAIDAGCSKDADGQDEELAMFGITNGMRAKAKADLKRSQVLETTRARRQGWVVALQWGHFDMTAPIF